MIVTIDGPAGTGKSTVARELAQRLHFQFLDTGAMYRAVAWFCLQHNLDFTDTNQIAHALNNLRLELHGTQVILQGNNISESIRSPEIAQFASIVAAIPAVRDFLVREQRNFSSIGDLVTEGRDQGTIVFPQAEFKFFLTARPEVRAQRRKEELQKQGKEIEYQQLLQELTERDKRDSTRAVAPLHPAADACIIDTSELQRTEVVQLLEERIRSHTIITH